jgi:hypothetical protein
MVIEGIVLNKTPELSINAIKTELDGPDTHLAPITM